MAPPGLGSRAPRADVHLVLLLPDWTPAALRSAVGRRAADRSGGGWQDTRDLLLASLAAPVRPLTRTARVLGALVVLAELTGLLARRTCTGGTCGPAAAAWAARLDTDALGSVPRTLITVVLAAAFLACLRGARVAGRSGAVVWWSVLAAGCALLVVAKHWSLHSVVEHWLAPLLPVADVQLLFLVVSAVGLLVAVVAGRWVRRDTRTAVATWLAVYAVAAVGLAAVSGVLAHLGPLAYDISSAVEETGEGLAAVGLLAVLRASTRELAQRVHPG